VRVRDAAGENARTRLNVVRGVVSGTVVQAATVEGGVHVHTEAAPVEMPVPRQLLPAPGWFADRSREFRELNRLLDDGGHRTGVVCGPGGVGKTALALRWMHDVEHRFPDGQLFADLGAFNPSGPVSPSEVLGRFLRALGIPAEAVPVRRDKGAELAEQAALYRSVTAGRSMAVLLDNAESVAQVRPLLPASETSVAVVTSRWQLGGLVRDGAFLVPVAPLGPDAAIELLTRSVGADRVAGEPGPADRLVELCGYMPLAVSIAGARLATRPRRSIARAADDLADQRSRLGKLSVEGDVSVAATFDLSYRELPAAAARSYRLLGLHPGPDFGHEVMAAAVGVPEETAEDLLDILVDASLLTEVGEDQYRFHDLLRLHARQRAEAEEDAGDRDSAVHRIIVWYLRATITADRTVIPLAWRLGPGYRQDNDSPHENRSSAQALDWLESALPNLMAALRAAVSRRWDALAWQLCEAMWSLFRYRRPMPEWTSATALGIEAAGRAGHRTAESQMRRLLGSALQEAGLFAEAEREAVTALTLAQEAGNELLTESALQLAGTALRSQGKYDQAVAVHRRSLALGRRIGDRRREALGLRRLGQSLCDAGQFDEAIQYLHEGCALAAALPDARVEAMTATALATALTRAGRPAAAIGLLESSLTTMRESGSDDYQATVLTALGDAAERLGDLTAAREYFRQAVALHAERDGPREQVARDRLAAVESRLANPPPAP
jgi:tetratricopeptide (TPR) repeat protein